MDIELSSEDLAFTKEVRAFFEENEMAKGEDYFVWRNNWFAKAKEKGGWDVPKWPVKFGGPGWTPTQHYIWEQETAKANIPFDIPFGLGMLAPILMGYGNKEQQERFLPAIRERTVNWCQGYSEPGAGSDLANLKTKAVLSEDGTYYTVNGSKMWTTLAHVADWIFCLTRTDDSGIKQQGITFLLFPMKQEGIEVKPIITLGGSHTVNTVHFTDVKVPVENLIGEEGAGWNIAKFLLAHERTGIGGIPTLKREIRRLREITSELPLGDGFLKDDDLFMDKLNKLEIDLLAAEYSELRTLAAMSKGGHPGPESSILKIKGTDLQQGLSDLFVEAIGYYAHPFMSEDDLASNEGRIGPDFAANIMPHYLNMRKVSIYGGSNEIQRNVIAKAVLGI